MKSELTYHKTIYMFEYYSRLLWDTEIYAWYRRVKGFIFSRGRESDYLVTLSYKY